MRRSRLLSGGASLVAGVCLVVAGCGDYVPGTGTVPEGPVEWETGANPEWGSGGLARGDGDFATGAPAPSAADAEGGGTAAEPMPPGTSTTTGNGQVQPGTLTAGSFDDHLNPGTFAAYWTQAATLSQQAPDLSQRALISVRDTASSPVSQAEVTVSSGGKVLLQTTTAADGRALFLPALDGAGSGSYEVSVAAGGLSTTATFALDQAPWKLTLDAPSPLPGKLDLAFIVDATGSMGDEIEFLKAETAHIASTVAAKHASIDMRFGLIVYRDEGDRYVTRGYGFGDLQQFQGFLAQQDANGGGDYPEAMHSALADAAERLPWRPGNVARVAFLLADAPPHDDKIGATFDAVAALRAAQVRVYPVAASGVADLAELAMRGAAYMTLGRYLFLTDDSGVGNSHAEPHVPCYEVEKLEQLMIRMIDSELSGELVAADPATVIRTVGNPVDGVCQGSGSTGPAAP